jgi:hypothetical protein
MNQSVGTVNPLISQQEFVYNNNNDFCYGGGGESGDNNNGGGDKDCIESNEESSDIHVKHSFHVTTCGHVVHIKCYLEV